MDVANMISSIGFPVVMCLLMYNQMNKQDETHKAEMEKITESLNNNTLAITQLSERLGKEV